LKQLAERVFIQTICAEVQAAIAGQSRLAWSIQLYLCQKYARMKLKDITAYFGEGESGFCQAVRRVILGFDFCKNTNRRECIAGVALRH